MMLVRQLEVSPDRWQIKERYLKRYSGRNILNFLASHVTDLSTYSSVCSFCYCSTVGKKQFLFPRVDPSHFCFGFHSLPCTNSITSSLAYHQVFLLHWIFPLWHINMFMLLLCSKQNFPRPITLLLPSVSLRPGLIS